MSTYNSPVDVQPVTLVRSSNVNDLDAAVAEAFGFLPDETLLKQGKHLYAVDTGTANTHLVSLPVSPVSYVDGLSFTFKAKTSNTAACTVNVNSLGVVAISREDGQDLVVGDIVAGQMCTVRYNVTTSKFQLQGTNAASSAVAAAASAATAATQAGIAATQAGIATTQANNAAASAATAVSAPGTASTSTSSISLTAGTKTFSTQAGKGYAVGASVKFSRTSDVSKWAVGSVVSYNSGTGDLVLSVDANDINGSGTFTDWTLSVSGHRGPQGASAATPALILLSTATASAVATVDITSLINSTYAEYLVVITGVIPSTNDSFLWMRTSTNAGSSFDAGASDYRHITQGLNEGTSNVAAWSSADTKIIISGAHPISSTGTGCNFTIRLHQPSANAQFLCDWTGSGVSSVPNVAVIHGAGIRATSADVDAIRFMFSTGNIASGEFRLYGVQKS